MSIELSDDGTLDTVLKCSDCGEEMRYNYEHYDPEPDEDDSADDGYDRFVEWAIEDATESHECPSSSTDAD